MAIELKTLDQRRARLRMTRAAVARRAGVSLPTVNRILSGKDKTPLLATVDAIARALGLTVSLEETESAEEYRLTQARWKARELVGLVQGTMALEAQGMDEATINRMIDHTAHKLLDTMWKLWE